MEGSYHACFDDRRRSRTCMHNFSRQISHDYGGWALAVPTWEKEFCFQVGSFKWNDLLEAKERSLVSPAAEKVIGWDDSGAREAFHNAKKRFFANKFSLDVPVDPMMKYPMPSPDLYNDLIEWDDDDSFGDHYYHISG